MSSSTEIRQRGVLAVPTAIRSLPCSHPFFAFQSSAQASPCLSCIPEEASCETEMGIGTRHLLGMLLVKLFSNR